MENSLEKHVKNDIISQIEIKNRKRWRLCRLNQLILSFSLFISDILIMAHHDTLRLFEFLSFRLLNQCIINKYELHFIYNIYFNRLYLFLNFAENFHYIDLYKFFKICNFRKLIFTQSKRIHSGFKQNEGEFT